MAAFVLCCASCGRDYEGAAAFRLRCDGELGGAHGPALLRSKYKRRQIKVREDLPGIFKFSDWLPTGSFRLDSKAGHLGDPCCYRSIELAKRLGLKNLYIGFSGYWPDKRANLVTRTFKEFEVQASMVCILQGCFGQSTAPLIISSAGNTANSYNYYTHLTGLPLYLFVPESGLGHLLLPFETHPTLIAVQGDYTDAINLADRVARHCGLTRDGGVFNPGRRAGMGTVMLNAVCHPEQGSQRLFDHYFQGVGSGSGAIAAWEAVQLLRQDGRFGSINTRIHMAQNAAFVPIVRAWKERRQQLAPIPELESHEQIAAVTAAVLTNRTPPYSVAGGLWDVLNDTNGETWEVSNENLSHAARLFRESEGVDINPAAAVALNALCQAVAAGVVKSEEHVLLHVTGGGHDIQSSEDRTFQVRPAARVKAGDLDAALSLVGTPAPMTAAAIENALAKYESAEMTGAGL